MEKKNGKTKKIVLSCAIIALVAVALFVVYKVAAPKPSKGAKAIVIQVTDNNGVTTDYQHNTDAEYLSQVFDEIDGLTVEGDVTEYGLYIKTINGVTADYDTDGAYWSIYVNGEYGSYGADSQPVADKDSYQFVYEVYSY